ncbi:MAG: cell wall-binding repeat-containing protein [Chloroflexota bacterium]
MRSLRLTSLAVAMVLATVAIGGHPTPSAAVGGNQFVQLSNVKRASEGKPPVGLSAAVDQISVERANAMASTDNFAHDLAYVERRLRELGQCFSGYGEIIAWERGWGSQSYQRTIDQWWASAGHHAIMAGDFNAAGGSWALSGATNKQYSVMVFVKLCSAPAPTPPPAPLEDVSRLAGADRYATAAAISSATFDPGAVVAFVATGGNFPDALAGAAAAAYLNGPVLLTDGNSLPGATANELARLRPGRIVILGGTGAISNGVGAALGAYAPVSRVSGGDRYETAAALSHSTFPAEVSVAYVSTGRNFPDALAGGAAAGRDRGPVLLVRGDEVPTATANELSRLRPGRIVILGASGVVSDAVARTLTRYSSNVSRLAGADRYATAVKVSQSGFKPDAPQTVYVATGANFPDGLAGGPVAGLAPGPLLLVTSNTLPSIVAAELQRLAPSNVVILGGPGTVSDAVARAIDAVVN